MKRGLLIVILFILFIGDVYAEGIEQKIETPLYKLSDEVFEVDRQRNFFTEDGFITVDYDEDYVANYVYDVSYLFTHYDNEGNVLKENKLELEFESSAYEGVYAIDYYNNSLYLFINGTYDKVRGYHLFVIDENLNISLKKTFTAEELLLSETETEDYAVTLDNYNIVDGKLAILVQKFNFWSLKSEYSINLFDLESLESEVLDGTEEIQKKYFYSEYLKSYYGDVDDISFYDGYVFVSYKTGNFARLDVYKDDKVVLAINNSKYASFSDIKIIDNYLIMIANYVSENVNSNNDILIYTMNGDLVKTISSNGNYHSLEVKDNQFLVGRYYEDGVCSIYRHHHSIKQNCISYVQHILYEVDIDKQEKVEIEENNPDTSSISIICGIVLVLGTLVIGIKSYHKYKQYE